MKNTELWLAEAPKAVVTEGSSCLSGHSAVATRTDNEPFALAMQSFGWTEEFKEMKMQMRNELQAGCAELQVLPCPTPQSKPIVDVINTAQLLQLPSDRGGNLSCAPGSAPFKHPVFHLLMCC